MSVPGGFGRVLTAGVTGRQNAGWAEAMAGELTALAPTGGLVKILSVGQSNRLWILDAGLMAPRFRNINSEHLFETLFLIG